MWKLRAVLAVVLMLAGKSLAEPQIPKDAGDVETKLEMIFERIGELEAELERQKELIDLQQETIDSQQKTINQQQVQLQTQHHKTGMLPIPAPEFPRKALVDTPAFSARASNGEFLYNVGQTILFEDDYYISPDNGYEPGLSFFQCPVTGLYFFSANIVFLLRSTEDYRGVVHMVQGSDQVEILNFYTSIFSGSSDMVVSNSVLTLCQQDDVVFMEAVTPTRISGDVHSTFTGFLIAEDVLSTN